MRGGVDVLFEKFQDGRWEMIGHTSTEILEDWQVKYKNTEILLSKNTETYGNHWPGWKMGMIGPLIFKHSVDHRIPSNFSMWAKEVRDWGWVLFSQFVGFCVLKCRYLFWPVSGCFRPQTSLTTTLWQKGPSVFVRSPISRERCKTWTDCRLDQGVLKNHVRGKHVFDASLLHFSRVANTIIVEKNRKNRRRCFWFLLRVLEDLTISYNEQMRLQTRSVDGFISLKQHVMLVDAMTPWSLAD